MRVEMHLHTSEASPCAQCSAAEAVLRCISKGYRAAVITDHFSREAAGNFGDLTKLTWEGRVRQFLCGYHNAVAAAPQNFSVLLGMELRFPENNNDYLVYGFDEAFLYENRDLDQLGLEKFSVLSRQRGLFLAQAHPFRRGMTIADTRFLDGMEVYNGNAHHDSRNAFAAQWARAHSLTPISGSDYHGGDTGDGVAPGGIYAREPVRTNADLLRVLRGAHYFILQ